MGTGLCGACASAAEPPARASTMRAVVVFVEFISVDLVRWRWLLLREGHEHVRAGVWFAL